MTLGKGWEKELVHGALHGNGALAELVGFSHESLCPDCDIGRMRYKRQVQDLHKYVCRQCGAVVLKEVGKYE